MEEKSITPQESLSIIQQMIADTRERVINDGFFFLLWGILVISGCLITYFAHVYKTYQIINPSWMILMVTGAVWSVIASIRQGRKERVKSHIGYIGQMLWMAFLASMFIVIFLVQDQELKSTILFILMGLATFTSGAILGFTPLYVGGVIFWGASIIYPQISFPYNSLFFAAMVFIGYVIPGLLLSRKVKKNKQVLLSAV